ncbi:MAG: GNAT family N-acetyltransferase [bacterium]
MNHCGTQFIETDRLILRKFSIDDAESMYRNWASDSEVTRYLTWPAHTSAEVSKAVLENWTASYAQKNYYQWAIILKSYGNDPIGSIGAVNMNDDISMVHIGYCIGRDWWHQGIMSEALKAVMDFFFDTVGVNRIECRHDPKNPHSGMVMKKCGMQYEGTMRSSDRNNQGICDACWYALLKSDRKTPVHQVLTEKDDE